MVHNLPVAKCATKAEQVRQYALEPQQEKFISAIFSSALTHEDLNLMDKRLEDLDLGRSAMNNGCQTLKLVVVQEPNKRGGGLETPLVVDGLPARGRKVFDVTH